MSSLIAVVADPDSAETPWIAMMTRETGGSTRITRNRRCVATASVSSHNRYPRRGESRKIMWYGMRSYASARSSNPWAYTGEAATASSALAACFHLAMSAPSPTPPYKWVLVLLCSDSAAMPRRALDHTLLRGGGSRSMGRLPPHGVVNRTTITHPASADHCPNISAANRIRTMISCSHCGSRNNAFGWISPQPNPVPLGETAASVLATY